MSGKLLYIMHVPWGWIKQRPHFIAEGLKREYDITILCPKSFKNNLLNETDIRVIELKRFPFGRLKIIKYVNNLLNKYQIRKYIEECDSIWVTSPLLISPNDYKCFSSKKVIYDCMDDMVEISRTNSTKVRSWENALYKRADIVFCSSNYLQSTLEERYFKRKNIHVINNAVRDLQLKNLSIGNKKSFLPCSLGKEIKLVYIGTIAKWFDFDLILFLLEKMPNVSLYLFGPKEVDIPRHEKIHYCGLVEHDFVFQVMEESDILVMPFKINKLILSVDPVKLYEYIQSGRPCLAPYYGESLKFKDYVYLYDSKDNCLEIINMIMKNGLNPKKDKNSSMNYIKNNTWDNRMCQIIDVLHNNNI